MQAFAYGISVLPGGHTWATALSLVELASVSSHASRACACMQEHCLSQMPRSVARCSIRCVYLAEIGATAKAPAERTMKRGIGMGYAIILSAYLTVSVTGTPVASDSTLPVHVQQAATSQGELPSGSAYETLLHAMNRARMPGF